MITHHLSDKLLMAYAAGNLPEAFNLVVATHVSMCDDCRARLAGFDAIGGVVLGNSVDPVSLSAGALSATLERIKAEDGMWSCKAAANHPAPSAHTNITPTDMTPAPLRDYIGGGLDNVAWRPVGGGVRQAILPTSRNASARLLYIPAGMAVPDHGHQGLELTLVLQGAFADAHDRFGRGDIEIADEQLQHTPVAEAGPDCICLAATDAPLKFRGWIPRLAQPFLQI